ncbi:MAG: hypothetical protein V7724_15880 [Sediminicola sp.]
MKKSIVLILLIGFQCCNTQEQEHVELQARLDALGYDDIKKNLVWLTQKFGDRSFRSSVLPTVVEFLFTATL